MLKGLIEHNFPESGLHSIVKKYQKINMVPEEYNFPELLRKEQLPQEMQEMLQRKAEHQQNIKDWSIGEQIGSLTIDWMI